MTQRVVIERSTYWLLPRYWVRLGMDIRGALTFWGAKRKAHRMAEYASGRNTWTVEVDS